MPSPFELRRDLETLAVTELLGPVGGPTEVLAEPNVRGRYIVGLLAPRGKSVLPEEADDNAEGGVDTEDGVTEAPSLQTGTFLPSSIGLTFALHGETTALRITARWGHYTRTEIDDDKYRSQKTGKLRRVWQREQIEGVSHDIPLKRGPMPRWEPSPDFPYVYVQGLMRERGGQWIVTLFLVNGQQEPKRNKDEAWVFQPELSVEAADGGTGPGAGAFEQRPLNHDRTDPEAMTLNMLYRNTVEFAVGHNVAVHADLCPGCTDRAVRVSTVTVPVYEVPPTTPVSVEEFPVLARLTLDMKRLAEVPNGSFGECLQPLVEAYGEWIAGLRGRIQNPAPDLAPYLDPARPVARQAVENCERTLTRIRAGIALLDADTAAADAFRFANRAMYLQRVRGIYAARVRAGERVEWAEIDVPRNHSWHVFQLAFILLNLPALTDLKHPERSLPLENALAYPGHNVADLLWFATGGGKTEAYLGLAAYALGIRRLQGVVNGRSGHAGVTVLMRYTLRLLTLQQFQRAATLICACEIMRREAPEKWGHEPFRIGLWVGKRTTPNTTEASDEALKALLGNKGPGGEGTPHQLTHCPWCGIEIEPRHMRVESFQKGSGRTLIFCGDPTGECPFSGRHSPSEGIPALTVDEEIYRRLPTLLIGTVDKFAQMPWNGRTAMLFGQVNAYCERHGYASPELPDTDHQRRGELPGTKLQTVGPLRPPDLIIQDELHLISGPLGTLVGLYEAAVDRLASWDVDGMRVRPKVIASSATVRRADGQVHSLFLRNVNIFPPSGLDAGDSFFARQRPPTEQLPGRRYLGIYAPGIRHKVATMSTYIAFMAAAKKLFDEHGVAVDPWMTMVGYFNSLRELGSMRRAVEDSVTTRLRMMDRHGLGRRSVTVWGVQELTSRLSATDIPDILSKLETPFPADGKPKGKQRPIDILLATNMISVGVDVSRLGVMVVNSQPKTTAEYIQATSRVGRKFPGLVAVVYNWTRPRDLSHYEQFEYYHATFYKHVEALSVTPFSARAVDRGLSGVMVALVRSLGLDLNDNDGAARVTATHPRLQEAINHIAGWAACVEGPATETRTRAELAARQDIWLRRIADTATGSAKLAYKEKNDGVTRGLLSAPEQQLWDPFTCLNSLRDVEPPVNLIVCDAADVETNPRGWTYGVRPAEDETIDDEMWGEDAE